MNVAVHDHVAAARMASMLSDLDNASRQRLIDDPNRTYKLAAQAFQDVLSFAQQEQFAGSLSQKIRTVAGRRE